MLRSSSQYRPIAIANWLLSVAFFVFLVVVVGGITRLTESGLSITQWNVVAGIFPPFSDAAWQAEFALYQQTTEYQSVNFNMTLAEFKLIYFWEYFHRLLARLVGLVFAVPLIYYYYRRAIPPGYGLRLAFLLFLGALQGVIGWWMVTSGLSGRTDVSHYRLAIHLLNALVIMALLVWTALDLFRFARHGAAIGKAAAPRGFGLTILIALFVQLLYGAWLAGLNAGHVASDWPLMQGQFFPAGVDWQAGLLTFADDPYLVHFIHRIFAWILAALLVVLALKTRPHSNGAAHGLLIAVALQIVLGIATVISGVNIVLAVLHQAAACLLLVATIIALYRLNTSGKNRGKSIIYGSGNW